MLLSLLLSDMAQPTLAEKVQAVLERLKLQDAGIEINFLCMLFIVYAEYMCRKQGLR